MSPAEPFPLYFPGDARRAFSSEEATRRFVRVAQLEQGAHVLVLACGTDDASVATLIQERGCSVVVADPDEAALSSLRQKLAARGLADRVEMKRVDLGALAFPPGAFEAILVPGPVLYPLPTALRTLRALLGMQGRVGLVYPARVGRRAEAPVLDFWKRRLGAPLQMPRDLLQVIESSGFEPESAETLTDGELDALYQGAEAHLPGAPKAQAEALREEISLHRQQAGQVVATYAFLIGRRKEPGEKPPAARDRG
ncbi:methyltransferase domain-containing protein [Myxococcaceae bacterium GXIMD 01537]